MLKSLNPLHHVPVVGMIYRAATGESIPTPMRVLGAGIVGGPVGALGAAFMSLLEELIRMGPDLSRPSTPADAAHTGGDIFVTVLAFISLLLTRVGYGRADPWLAIVVALIIGWSGYQILRVTVPILVDQRAVDGSELRRLVAAIPGITGVPNVRSRTSASGVLFAEVTILCDGALSVAESHQLADAAEAAIRDTLGTADVTVHVEPS